MKNNKDKTTTVCKVLVLFALCINLAGCINTIERKIGRPNEIEKYRTDILSHNSLTYEANVKKWLGNSSDTTITTELVSVERFHDNGQPSALVYVKSDIIDYYFDGANAFVKRITSASVTTSKVGISDILQMDAILPECIDTTAWYYLTADSSQCSLENRIQSCTYFLKGHSASKPNTITYGFPYNKSFPCYVLRQTGNSKTYIQLKLVRYNSKPDRYLSKEISAASKK